MMEGSVPQHVAVILDGNGRWAKKRGLPRNAGHVRGAKAVTDILKDVDDLGIRYFTVYAFSTENWSRPEDEVSALMTLISKYIVSNIPNCMEHNIRCSIIGRRDNMPEQLLACIREVEEATRNNTGLRFTVAINYGGRDEVTRAVQRLALRVKEGSLKPGEITETDISDALDTAGIPDPDLLIRTCGEQRLSNFLLWQLAYSELYFTPVAWPDFNRQELEKAIEAYGMRDRKFGGLKDSGQSESEADR